MASTEVASQENELSKKQCLVVGIIVFILFGIISIDFNAADELNAVDLGNFHEIENQIGSRQKSTTKSSAVGYLGMAVVGVWCLTRAPGSELHFKGPAFWSLAALIAVSFASVLWSVNSAQTIRKLVVFLLFLIAAVGMARNLTIRDLGRIITIVTGIFVAVGILNELRLGSFRPWSGEYRFVGATHPNTQAVFCSLFCIGLFMGRKPLSRYDLQFFVLLGVGILFLYLTKSRTAAGALIAASGISWLLSSNWERRLLFGSVGVASFLLFLIVISLVSKDPGDSVGSYFAMGRTDHVTQLTGRVPLWEELIDRAESKPVLGYGYGAFWDAKTIEDVSSIFFWHIPSAHSIYIDMLLSLGIVGLSCFLLSLLCSTGTAALRYFESRDTQDLCVFTIMIFMLIHGFSESKFAGTGFEGLIGLIMLLRLSLHSPPKTVEVRPWKLRKTQSTEPTSDALVVAR